MTVGSATNHPMQQHASLLDSATDVLENGLPAGTYYIAMIGNDDANGVWSSIAGGNATAAALFEFCVSALNHVQEATKEQQDECTCGNALMLHRMAAAALQAIAEVQNAPQAVQ